MCKMLQRRVRMDFEPVKCFQQDGLMKSLKECVPVPTDNLNNIECKILNKYSVNCIGSGGRENPGDKPLSPSFSSNPILIYLF